VDAKTLGSQYGRTLRRYLSLQQSEKDAVAVMESVTVNHDCSGRTVILAGSGGDFDKSKLRAILASARKVILLNPTFFPKEINFDPSKPASAFFGEFSQSPALQAWRDLGIVHTVEGKGDFLENWPELIFQTVNQK
jgi:hypothetical protein